MPGPPLTSSSSSAAATTTTSGGGFPRSSSGTLQQGPLFREISGPGGGALPARVTGQPGAVDVAGGGAAGFRGNSPRRQALSARMYGPDPGFSPAGPAGGVAAGGGGRYGGYGDGGGGSGGNGGGGGSGGGMMQRSSVQGLYGRQQQVQQHGGGGGGQVRARPDWCAGCPAEVSDGERRLGVRNTTVVTATRPIS